MRMYITRYQYAKSVTNRSIIQHIYVHVYRHEYSRSKLRAWYYNLKLECWFDYEICAYIYIKFLIILNYFSVHLVSNVGSHSKWYVLIVPHISEYWPIDGLIRQKHIATIKHFVLLCSIMFWKSPSEHNSV